MKKEEMNSGVRIFKAAMLYTHEYCCTKRAQPSEPMA